MKTLDRNMEREYFHWPTTCATLIAGAVLVLIASEVLHAASHEQKLIASDGAAYDQFGTWVAVSEEIAVIGAVFDDDNGADSGSAYVFLCDAGSGEFREAQKLVASDGAAYDRFGLSVAVDGYHVVVGAAYDDNSESNSGSAYVFQYDPSTGVWEESQKLIASDGARYDQFGMSVAIAGDRIVIAAPYDDDRGANSGSAYVFQYDPFTGVWEESQKLIASDGSRSDQFGTFVAISGDRIAVGAPFDDDGGVDSGSVYIFEYNTTTGQWEETQKLVASNGMASDQFGTSVAMGEDYLLVGAPLGDDDVGADCGAAYVFAYDATAALWEETQKLIASDRSEQSRLGSSVALAGTKFLIGAAFDDERGSDSGAAYVFEYDASTGSWQEEEKLTASDGAALAFFGASVAISADRAVLSSKLDDSIGTNSGSTYVYAFGRENGQPVADAGPYQEVAEGSWVVLDGSGSSDPDDDPLTFAWGQTFGPAVDLWGADTRSLEFLAPLVGPDGALIVLELVVNDGSLDAVPSEVKVEIVNVNDPPACDAAFASPERLWPPTHRLVPVEIMGVQDPQGDRVTITVNSVTQDEPARAFGKNGSRGPDSMISDGRVFVRAQRAARGNGRVYRVSFTAEDGSGESASGTVSICVPRGRKSDCVDDGQDFDSLAFPSAGAK